MNLNLKSFWFNEVSTHRKLNFKPAKFGPAHLSLFTFLAVRDIALVKGCLFKHRFNEDFIVEFIEKSVSSAKDL